MKFKKRTTVTVQAQDKTLGMSAQEVVNALNGLGGLVWPRVTRGVMGQIKSISWEETQW